MNFTKILVIIIYFLSINSSAQSIWEKVDENIFHLNNNALFEALKSVGDITNIFIEFPNTNGNLEAFEIKENNILLPALANKYPSIHTYVGRSIYHESLSINFTISGNTLFATLMEGIQTWDILNEEFTNNYYVVKPEENFNVKVNCRTEDTSSLNSSPFNITELTDSSISEKTLIGDNTLRTLRIAVLTTTEYSNFFTRNLPSTASETTRIAAVLSGIAASLNNINAVFERDLGIHFELIDNNDELIFQNNVNSGITLNEGGTIITNTIGTANFDIGHTLNGQGDGRAFVGGLCSSNKANAISGLSTPQGSFFDFSLFAHELGHQLGANHTQNIQCQREGDFSSVETGAGSTIMGYAGVDCGDPDIQIQGASDEYFHYVSIIQIRNHVQSAICGIESATVTNVNPVIINPPNYTIPVNTSFVLETDVSDADGDNLTYAWEQIDGEEAEMPPVATSTLGPLFRSFPPTTSLQRFFPKDGVNSKWEVLPTVEREMNFSLTVRDDNPGGIATTTLTVNTVDTGEAFAIIAPINGLRTPQNSLQTIEWNVAGTDANGINVENVEIEISYDGGRSYEVLFESTPNDGIEIFKVPNTTISDQARIRINAIDNIFYAVGESNFNISEQLDDDLSDFSNPTEKTLSIQVARLQVPQYSISIFDLRGAIVYEAILSSASVELNMETLGRGFYIVKIVVGSQIYTEKIFKT